MSQYIKPTITDIIARLPRHPESRFYRTRPLNVIMKIVVHYDGVAIPTSKEGVLGYDPVTHYASQANFHINKNWNTYGGPVIRGFGLMYHYRLSADGCIWRTQPENLVL